MTTRTVLWRRLDEPGFESARLMPDEGRWLLGGTAVFLGDGQPCRLDYQVQCGADWRTQSVRLAGWIGRQGVSLQLTVDAAGNWRLDGQAQPALAGCLDVDLSFTPATNLLPIRRLELAIGEAAPVRAAWLRMPALAVAPLAQRYSRTGAATYRYESDGFQAELKVDEAGFVVDYPGLWEQVASARDWPG